MFNKPHCRFTFNKARRLPIAIALMVALLECASLPWEAHAASNGQQLIVKVCGAKSIQVSGTNQNGQATTYTKSVNSDACSEVRITNWWWKGQVTVTASYPGQRINKKSANVPRSQKGDWYTIEVPNVSVERGKLWVDAGVPYSQSPVPGGYRTDCSGFVSYAWQLRASEVTGTLGNFAKEVSVSDLIPGDALNNKKKNNDGHVVLFVRWTEKGKSFEAYEENARAGRAVRKVLHLETKSDGVRIKEYDIGPVVAQRRR